MKRTTIILSLIFALAIALSVSIPTVALNEDTENVTVQGVLGGHIEITSSAIGTINLPDLEPDVQKYSTPVDITVRCNKAGWTLVVTDADGYLDDGEATPTNLTNPLYVMGGDQGTYAPLTGAVTLETNGAKGTAESVDDITFRQEAEWADTADTYSTIVTFTADATP